MTDFINVVNYKVIIYFSNSQTYTLKSEHTSNETYIESLNIEENLAVNNQNPVGVVSTNTVKISIDSEDLLFIPSNKNSKYYGYMNNTAYLDIFIIESGEELSFGRYYISNWENNATSENPYHVIIEGTDLLGIINKNRVPTTELRKDMLITDTLDNIIVELNKKLDEKYKVKYDKTSWTFGPYTKLDYNNIDADDMGTWFNILSQSTLTNLYYNRENMLETDYCLDDKKSDIVCNIHGDKNVLSVNIDKGGLVGYSNIKVNYILNEINNNTQLVELRDQALTPGENRFDNIELNGKVYKITSVKIKTDQKEPAIKTSITYDKKIVSLVIDNKSKQKANCSIVIYGQTLKENKLYITKNKTGGNDTLEVTNRLLPKEYIDRFANGLLSILGIKDSSISVTGYFNPRIKLGDQVDVKISRLNLTGPYKIIGLSWKIQGSIECTAKLIKTIT